MKIIDDNVPGYCLNNSNCVWIYIIYVIILYKITVQYNLLYKKPNLQCMC